MERLVVIVGEPGKINLDTPATPVRSWTFSGLSSHEDIAVPMASSVGAKLRSVALQGWSSMQARGHRNLTQREARHVVVPRKGFLENEIFMSCRANFPIFASSATAQSSAIASVSGMN